jgi:hypothetical protein
MTWGAFGIPESPNQVGAPNRPSVSIPRIPEWRNPCELSFPNRPESASSSEIMQCFLVALKARHGAARVLLLPAAKRPERGGRRSSPPPTQRYHATAAALRPAKAALAPRRGVPSKVIETICVMFQYKGKRNLSVVLCRAIMRYLSSLALVRGNAVVPLGSVVYALESVVNTVKSVVADLENFGKGLEILGDAPRKTHQRSRDLSRPARERFERFRQRHRRS